MPGGVTAVCSGEILRFAPAGRTLSPQAGETFPADASEYRCELLAYDGNADAIPRNLYTKWFDYDKIGMFPVFRTRRAGDRMTLLDGRAQQGTIRKKLSRIMLDGKVPAQIREEIVLPFAGEEALWIPGLRMSDAFRITPGTRRILQIRWAAKETARRRCRGSRPAPPA